MRTIFVIKDISTYRSELMGWSILWIMMLHFTFNQIYPLGFVAQYGFAGVDIFMMVSGLGLYYSLNSSHSILFFYKKRLLRIFPTYYFLGFFSSFMLFNDNIWNYLFRYSTIGFWTGDLYWEWFIPSILLLYLLSPFFKYLLEKSSFLLFFICVCIIFFAYYLLDKDQYLDRAHFFLLYRIPSFVFGMACAHWIKNSVSSKYFFIFLLVGIPSFIYFFPNHHEIYNYKYFSLLFLLPLFTVVFVLISKFIKFPNPLMRKIGNASLEIYLIQSMFFHAIINKLIIVPPKWHDTLTILLIVLCVMLGITIHCLIDNVPLFRSSQS